jgi:diguanylate cyclase (GGDEF)-like protein/PAS domain S-box-containing protein
MLSEASFEGVAITNAGVVVDTNSVFASWFGRSAEDLIGEQGLSLFAPDDHDLVKQMSLQSASYYEARMLRPDGSQFPVEVRGRQASFRGTPVRIAVIRDVTEKKQREAELRKHAERLKDLSLKDELSGLLNRRGLMEHGGRQLRNAVRNNKTGCLFFIDLNGMKGINDTLGHELGDRALVAAANVLRLVFRDSDVITRLGGDEFAVLASDCGEEDVAVVRERLSARSNEYNRDSGERFRLSMSVGSAVFDPTTSPDLDRLVEAADRCMYEQKRAVKAMQGIKAPHAGLKSLSPQAPSIVDQKPTLTMPEDHGDALTPELFKPPAA